MSTAIRTALGVVPVAALLLLGACGQRGPLYTPTDPAAAQRATLPQTVVPGLTPERPESESARPPRNDTTVPAPGVRPPVVDSL